MRDVAIIGVGLCPFGFFPDRTIQEMGEDAAWNALQDAGIDPKEIQIAYCGVVGWDISVGPSQYGQIMLEQVGIDKIPITRVENMCCSGSCAFREAWIAVGSGLYDVALAIGVEKMTPQNIAEGVKAGKAVGRVLQGNDNEGSMGLFPPVMFSLSAHSYMERYNISREDFRRYMSLVTEKNRFNGTLNPYASFQKAVTREEIMNSQLIADPLRLLDCCAEIDGCAVAILASKEAARKYTTKPVYVAATSQVSGSYSFEDPAYNHIDINQRVVSEAYESAGIGPEDIDLAVIHDCFSVAEILWMDGLGFSRPGEAGQLLESGETGLGGRLPINTDGGLLSKGHPLGATGIAMIVEAVKQLKGEAGQRQVEGAKAALCHNEGGILKGFIGNCSIHILKR